MLRDATTPLPWVTGAWFVNLLGASSQRPESRQDAARQAALALSTHRRFSAQRLVNQGGSAFT
eukprot:8393249-Pyramimonas_sp.AAC.1